MHELGLGLSSANHPLSPFPSPEQVGRVLTKASCLRSSSSRDDPTYRSVRKENRYPVCSTHMNIKLLKASVKFQGHVVTQSLRSGKGARVLALPVLLP